MKSMKASPETKLPEALPWNFEAYREYVSYEVLQSAAAVFRLYEGEIASPSNPRIAEMQALLQERTGKSTWVPSRTGSEGILWNAEGDLYRNKGRLLASIFILEPKDESDPKIRLLPFGISLALGQIDEQSFYKFVITRFSYPHPVWSENWNAWTKAGRSLKPLVYLLQVLVGLDASAQDQAFLTTDEIARHLYPDSNHAKVGTHVREILEGRRTKDKPKIPRTDLVHRKIDDILGFLCVSGYCYYRSDGSVGLNLRTRHTRERAHYDRKREGEDRLEVIKDLISEAMES